MGAATRRLPRSPSLFVISGYLITSLVLAEWLDRGRLNLKEFWFLRARRLLPALLIVVVGALAYSVAFLPDEVAGLRGDALAAFAYVMNWHLVFSHQSYFESMGRPSLLLHLWSLAIEEQFYLLYPPFLFLALKWFKPRGALIAVLLGAAVSIALMSLSYQPDADPSRIYYGTDTRASALLIGAALAFVWKPWAIVARQRTARVMNLAGWGALAWLGIAFVWLDEFQPFLYLGGFLTVSLATAAVIGAVVQPGTMATRILGGRVLRWLGTRSHSLYLWHWLVFDLTRPWLDVSLDGIPLFIARLTLSGVLAEISYRAVEMPFRSGAVGHAWNALRQASGPRRRELALRWGGALGLLLIVTIVLGGSIASAQAPMPSPDLVGESVFSESKPIAALPAPALTPTIRSTATPSATATSTRAPEPGNAPAAGQRGHVTVIGDSVALGAAGELARALADEDTDAALGRQVSQAIGILRTRRAAGPLAPIVVVHLGNNGPISAKQFADLMSVLGGVRRVVLVNVQAPRAWEAPNNALMAQASKQYPNVVTVDWHAAGSKHPEYFWKDGIHLRPAGAQAYANLIAAAINAP